MSNPNGRQIINTNRVVIVNFDSNINTGTSNIYVPFPVHEIHIKGVDIDWDADYTTIYFLSNLVDYGPVGAGFAGALSDMSTSTKKLRYIFPQPRDINGSYTFEYQRVDKISVDVFPDNDKGHVCFIMEFLGYM